MTFSLFFTGSPSGAKSAQSCLFVAAALCGLVIAFGCYLNNLGQKYIRVSRDSSGYNELKCNRELLVLDLEESNFCCDGIRSSDWVCVAAFDKLNGILTSEPFAYFLPLMPLLLTSTLLDRHSLRRLPFYAVLFIFRLVVMYWGLGYAQKYFFSLKRKMKVFAGTRNIVANGTVSKIFDFSDHIVFFVAQVIVPSAIEFGYAVHSEFGFLGIRNNRKRWLRVLPIALASLMLVYLSMRALLYSMFFHTPQENAVGFVLVMIIVLWPVSRWLEVQK